MAASDARRVLVTGARGQIAGQVVPRLRDRHEITAVDVVASDDVLGLDLVAEPERLAELMAGQDAVLHLANQPPSDGQPHDQDQGRRIDELYRTERSNIDLAQAVLRAALEAGVRRVVVASSNQAAKWYETPFHAGLRQHVSADEYPKPDSFYGWAKVAYESLGFLYASGALGRQLEVVMLRIVVPRQVRLASFVGRPVGAYLRDIAGYISDRDLAHLVERSILAEPLADEDGVPFVIAYGTSANARRFWDLGGARRRLGYEPLDDSEVAFAPEIRAVLDDGGPMVTRHMVERASAPGGPGR